MNTTIFPAMLLVLSPLVASAQTLVQLEWSAVYDGDAHGVDLPAASTSDRSGNLYVTGRSSGIGSGQDYATLQYSPQGQPLQVLRYNGPANSWDEATGIAVDDSGCIYVTGLSFYTSIGTHAVTIKYAPNGSVLWLANYPADSSFGADAIALALHSDGVTIAGSPDLTVVRYSPQGAELWARTFRRDTSMVNTVKALAVTPQGDVYVTGQVSEECPEGICRYDMVTLKYASTGNLEWVRYFSLTNASDEQPVAIALDSAGNVLVTAASMDSQGNEDILLVKYSPSGTLEWSTHYDGISSSYDSPRGIVVDQHSNVIVIGTSWNNAEAFNYSIVKFGPSGNQLWSGEYNHGNITRDFANGVTLDSRGDIYMTGSSRYGIPGKDSCVTVKFGSSGNLVWSASYSRPDTGSNQGMAVSVDSTGNVYVTGSSVARNGLDYFSIKYRQIMVGVEEGEAHPGGYILHQNFPNPFNPGTTISFSIPQTAFVTLDVFNILGEQVASLVSDRKSAGTHHVRWNPDLQANGVYFYRLQAGSLTHTRKLLLLR